MRRDAGRRAERTFCVSVCVCSDCCSIADRPKKQNCICYLNTQANPLVKVLPVLKESFRLSGAHRVLLALFLPPETGHGVCPFGPQPVPFPTSDPPGLVVRVLAASFPPTDVLNSWSPSVPFDPDGNKNACHQCNRLCVIVRTILL